MATMDKAQINQLAQASQSFIPPAADAPLRTFLSLAPTSSAPYTPRQERPLPERTLSGYLPLIPATSASYPRPPLSRHQPVSHITRPLPLSPGAEEQPNPFAARSMSSASISAISEPKSRRSSSMSSDVSTGKSRLRFLKLGPVHWGEHQGDHKEDWHVVDEEAISP